MQRNLKEYDLEQELQDLRLSNKQMETELLFKKEKIDKLEHSLAAINEKLDKLIERSEERDNLFERRLVALETSQSNTKTFVTIAFSLMSILIGALGLVVGFLH